MSARFRQNERIILQICFVFSLVLLAFFGLGWRLNSILRNYLLISAILGLFLYARYRLGGRSVNRFLSAQITRSIVIVLLIYAILCYSLGLFLGFNRGYFSLDLVKIFVGFLPTLLMALSLALLRANLLKPDQQRFSIVVFFTILTILLYLLIELNAGLPNGAEQIFLFICTTALPIIARESLCAFIAYRVGLIPSLAYKLSMVLYPYLLPIVPDLGDYLHSVVNLLLPFVIFLLVARASTFRKDEIRHFRGMNLQIFCIPVLIFSIILTILISGVFYYQLIAIGSDSMRPVYARGDTVLFEKVAVSEITKGDILVFRRAGIVITHRVVEINITDGIRYFTTKGDNNDEVDNFETSSDQVLGRVVAIGKYLGFPTLWINALFTSRG